MSTYGVKDIQERYGVGMHTVLGWIHSGELDAVDVRRTGSSRPKWRITKEALEAFEMLRAGHSIAPLRNKKKRRRITAPEVY